VTTQRAQRAAGRLQPQRVAMLDAVHFVWCVLAEAWETQYAMLRAYKDEHGHCFVIRGAGLGLWTATQRRIFKEGKMAPARVEKLDALGFVWDKFALTWERHFVALQAFQDSTGHCQVLPTDELGSWVHTQRKHHRENRMAPERARRLQALGFKLEFNTHIASWEAQFAMLRDFKQRQGHCIIPRTHPLNRWLGTQGKDFRNGRMKPERAARIMSLGVRWNACKRPSRKRSLQT
jgi:hypothetical protein